VEWNFGNWDIEAWLMGMAPPMSEQERTSQGLKSKDFKRYSDHLVFRYVYKPSLTRHGGVKVTYKPHLSTTGTAREAEWLPIETTEKNGFLANVTTEDGVIFIPHPPDLRTEPLREEWELVKGEGPVGAHKAMQRILGKRESWELSDAGALDWKTLAELHKDKQRAGMMPDMPYTIEVEGDESTAPYLEPGSTAKRTFDGTPSKLLPILQELCKDRFQRPSITWDIFREEPPHSFPWHPVDAVATEEVDEEVDGNEASTNRVRDPRAVNACTHIDMPLGSANRLALSAEMEAWTVAQPRRVEKAEKGHLYFAQLEQAEGEFHLGLCRVQSIEDSGLIVYWYARVGTNHSWGYNACNFKQYGGEQNWAFQEVPPESILLEVHAADLTPNGQLHQLTRPTTTKDFMEKLRFFVDYHHNRLDNVLVSDADELPPDPPNVRPGPKARPTSSSRRAAAVAARPMPESRATSAQSSEAAAHREATATLVAANAQLNVAAAEKQRSAAALKVKQAAKAAEKAAVVAVSAAAVASWVASAGGAATQGSSRNPVGVAPASKGKAKASQPATSMHESAPAPPRVRKTHSYTPFHEPALPTAAPPAPAAVARKVGSKAALDGATSTSHRPPAKHSKPNQEFLTAAQGRPRRSGN
jgi:hypothetical protein